MLPIAVHRLVRPARATAVVLAITVLTSGAIVPAIAASPTTGPAGGSSSPAATDERLVGAVPGSLPPGTPTGPTADRTLGPRPGALAAADGIPTGNRAAAPAVKPVVPPTARPTRHTAPTREHHGRNHVWSAGLGLDRSVSWFSCSRSRPPDYAVYRWGCAGANNVYLFAHAGGPFRRLHDLYVRGRLQRGMTVIYADATGRVHHFAVAWWKTVLPTAGGFAYAAQARPSMTLQTCVGPHDRYRLVVRLYQTD